MDEAVAECAESDAANEARESSHGKRRRRGKVSQQVSHFAGSPHSQNTTQAPKGRAVVHWLRLTREPGLSAGAAVVSARHPASLPRRQSKNDLNKPAPPRNTIFSSSYPCRRRRAGAVPRNHGPHQKVNSKPATEPHSLHSRQTGMHHVWFCQAVGLSLTALAALTGPWALCEATKKARGHCPRAFI